MDRGRRMQPQPVGCLEVDEQQPDLGTRAATRIDVAHRQEHPVAVVAREHDRVLVLDVHHAGRPALVRHGRPAVGTDRREEEEVARLDERPPVVVDALGDDRHLMGVGQSTGVELVLERSLGRAVEVTHRAILT